jgi:hypothetical protein
MAGGTKGSKRMFWEIRAEMIERNGPNLYSIVGYPMVLEYSDMFQTLIRLLHVIKYVINIFP